MLIAADGNRTHRRRVIDFTSNPPNMTTVTCQRSRIVSPTGIVPIRRYIFVAFRDFFPKTAGRRTASENEQATISRVDRSREEKLAKTTSMPRRRTTVKATCYRFSVIFSGLRHLTAFRHYQEPISMSRLFIPQRDSRPARIAAHLFVEEDAARRPDAAWISWKSGGVQHANSIHPAAPVERYKYIASVLKYFAYLPRASTLFIIRSKTQILEDFWRM
ncbi:hypothetical protein ALC57_17395 [Trachymyrmex cornetzi]|uniref:Uncharacterized protein n=1 Tax=Trachymyrmex cornetzi TaxID=471704 RepID=A0A151ITP1_9HYME|nr:hypothetical protein ALC57_17395 [Trachymyrmex cornetzi]